MSAVNLDQARFNMVEQQVRPWDVLDPKILRTLEQIPREAFVPAAYKNLAYADTAIPLGHNEAMMHPIMEGRLLQALDIQPTDEILEIGTGSGYLTACLAHLGSRVDSIDIYEDLSQQAAACFVEQGIFNVNLSTGDASHDTDFKKSYDVIAITGAMNEVPESYKKALAIGGRMFVITGKDPAMVARLITRTDDNAWAEQILFETSIKSLVNMENNEQFTF
ncbi:MAG: protein-L-isoaspartate O-methyltransferase [Gammaproteobacteria bacterium]|nr:protein-L-isoaspartate O-methyltransferase [Gammaproteobacteria bacterium]